MSPCLGQGEKGSGGAEAALPAPAALVASRGAGAENSAGSPQETRPWGVQVPPVPWPPCRDITSATAEPLTGCRSTARLLQVAEGEARRGPSPRTGTPPAVMGGKNEI